MAALTLKDVQVLSEKLREAPDLPAEKKTLTKKEAILELKPAIEQLRARGYSVEQIASLLTQNGMAISFGSLRQYLAERQGGSRRKKKGSAPSATAGSPQPPASAGATGSASVSQALTGATARPATDAKGGKTDKKGFKVRPDTRDI